VAGAVSAQSHLLALISSEQYELESHFINLNEINIVSSSLHSLVEQVELREFNEQLYHQVRGLTIDVPSVRERLGDVYLLAQLFLSKIKSKLGNDTLHFSDDCRHSIETYPWPGNLAQMSSAVASAVASSEKEYIEWQDLGLPSFDNDNGFSQVDMSKGLEHLVKAYEADILRKLYPAHPSSRQLAKVVGMSHTSVANKLREYNINKKTVKT